MLSKNGHVPQLRDDPDFVCFLLSENFLKDAKERTTVEPPSYMTMTSTMKGCGSRSDSVADVGSATSSIGGSVVALQVPLARLEAGFM